MAKLVFYYSSMNSGKSLSIITKNYMLNEKGFKTCILKPDIDNRSSGIKTRIGLEVDCTIVGKNELPSEKVLIAKNEKPDFILVDEAQFMSSEQIWNLAELVDSWDIDVLCYGLRIDWQGNFFTGSEVLMKIADELLPIENFCKENKGAYAYFHVKKGGNDNPVETGYEDLYDTVSRKVWKKWHDRKNK